MELHFWIATIGIVLYVVAITVWHNARFDVARVFGSGGLRTRLSRLRRDGARRKLMPMYSMRVVGGLLYFAGTLLMFGWNIIKRRYASLRTSLPVIEAAPHARTFHRQ
jgi:cbb3-type cytochrome oxidase subunit 1